jgi:hypothetical protein
MSLTYNSPGLIPGTPSPIAQVSFPESLTNMNKSPSAYALASLVYPGPLLADLPTVLALGGFDQQVAPLGPAAPKAGDIPAYPVRAEAFFPSGPTSKTQDVGSGRESVVTAADSAKAQAFYGAATLPPLVNAGSIVSTTETHLEKGHVVSRTRVELNNVDLVAGLMHIDSIVTDLVGTSDATAAASDGTTTASGVTFLGQPATLDGTGIHLAPQAADPGTKVTLPPLGPVTGGAQQALDPLNQLIVSTVGSANTGINGLLKAGGITIQLIQPTEVKKGGEVSRLASGVLVTINYTGDSEPVLGSILSLIKPQDLPSQAVDPCATFGQSACPLPFSSPQSLVLALKATHVETIGLASGHVHSSAAAPFATPKLPPPSGRLSTPSSGPSSGFSTPTPTLGGGGGGGAGGGGPSIGSAVPLAFVGGEPLAAVVSLLVLLLAGSGFWFGSGRLADNVLSVASSSCPEGLDE